MALAGARVGPSVTSKLRGLRPTSGSSEGSTLDPAPWPALVLVGSVIPAW
jgi:hypothetical protein